MPPRVQRLWVEGSGPKRSPCGRAAAWRSSSTTPGWTVAVAASGSRASTRRRCRDRSMTTPGPTALPAIEVPAPLAVSGTPSPRQVSTTATTSSRSRGKTTSSGATRYSEASVEYSARRRAELSTSPTPALRRAAAAASASTQRRRRAVGHGPVAQVRGEDVPRLENVLAHQRLGARRVPLLQGLRDPLVVMERDLLVLGRVVVVRAVRERHPGDGVHEGGEGGAPGGARDDAVEGQVLLDQRDDVGLVEQRLEPGAALAQQLDVVVGHEPRRPPRRVALGHRPGLVQVADLGGPVRPDDRAALRSGLHEALGLEDQQGLPDRRAADAELGGEALLTQWLAGIEPALDDRLADQLGRDVGRVADHARRDREEEVAWPLRLGARPLRRHGCILHATLDLVNQGKPYIHP